jgi:hypothetical protein
MYLIACADSPIRPWRSTLQAFAMLRRRSTRDARLPNLTTTINLVPSSRQPLCCHRCQINSLKRSESSASSCCVRSACDVLLRWELVVVLVLRSARTRASRSAAAAAAAVAAIRTKKSIVRGSVVSSRGRRGMYRKPTCPSSPGTREISGIKNDPGEVETSETPQGVSGPRGLGLFARGHRMTLPQRVPPPESR